MRGGRRFPAPFGGPGDQFAVAVALGDVGDDERGQAALDGERLAAARDRALGLQILEEELQFRLGFALDAEGAGDVALGDARRRALAVGRRRSADEGDHLLARRKRSGSRLSHAAVGLRRAPTDFLILQGFHFSGRRKRPDMKLGSTAQGYKPELPGDGGRAAQRPPAFSILSSVNSFIGASSRRSTIRASGREPIQSPTAE